MNMSCCLRSVVQATDEPLGPNRVNIRFLHSSTLSRRGSVTGRRYVFQGSAPVQPVDARDAPAILRDAEVFRPV
jgi:hypothetical protein